MSSDIICLNISHRFSFRGVSSNQQCDFVASAAINNATSWRQQQSTMRLRGVSSNQQCDSVASAAINNATPWRQLQSTMRLRIVSSNQQCDFESNKMYYQYLKLKRIKCCILLFQCSCQFLLALVDNNLHFTALYNNNVKIFR